jgi:hypothetical protein
MCGGTDILAVTRLNQTRTTMIASPTETGWLIIHHPAHALLAFQLALQWKIDKRPVRWPETLTTIDTHDDRQPEWKDRNHLTEAGAPLNFRIREFTAPDMNTTVGGARQKSRWNTMLLAMHAAFLYQHEAEKNPELDKVMAQLETNRKRWRKSLGSTPKEEQYAYDFVQFCDALSLILVENQLPIDERRLEVSTGPDGKPYVAWQRTDGSVGMSPWPFETDEFTVHSETYPVNQLAFADDAELFRLLEETVAVEKQWTFRKE